MENFNDVKSLWQSEKINNCPQLAEIKNAIHQFNRNKKMTNYLFIITLISIIIISFLLIGFAEFKMWTTYTGILLWIGIAFNLINSKIKRHNKLSELETLSNNDFLNELKKEENKNCTGKSQKQTTIFIIWAIAFTLYIYEYSKQNILFLAISYGALALLILVAWYFYRPFMTKRYQKSIQKTIKHINNIKFQFNEDK